MPNEYEHDAAKAARATCRVTVRTYGAPTASQRRVQVAAARLRVTLDERLGRATPAKTRALAKEAL